MLRALAPHQDGRAIIILGVDQTNIERLVDGQPIMVDTQASELEGGLGVESGPVICIYWAETTEDLLAALAEVTGEDTIALDLTERDEGSG
jgi:hypothetical protein